MTCVTLKGSDVSDTTITSPLHQQHQACDAHFGMFSGWDMPLRYAGTLLEHEAVRTGCGIFDVSHLGVVDVHGPDARDVIAAALTNDVTVLNDGDAQYTLCLTTAGHVIDDLIVYRGAQDHLRVIPNASNTTAVVEALNRQAAARDATVTRRANQVILAVQGPTAAAVVSAMLHTLGTTCDLDTVDYMTFRMLSLNDGGDLMLSRTGYTGEYGFELVGDAAHGPALWNAALAAHATPCGLAARDTLRLEMGYPLHGHELTNGSTPLGRNVGFAVRRNDLTFAGADALAAAPAPTAVMRGVRGEGKRPFRDGMTVFADGIAVGTLTSGGFSPTLGVAVGLGMIDGQVPLDANVTVDVRGTLVPAVVTRPPFVDADPRRKPRR